MPTHKDTRDNNEVQDEIYIMKATKNTNIKKKIRDTNMTSTHTKYLDKTNMKKSQRVIICATGGKNTLELFKIGTNRLYDIN